MAADRLRAGDIMLLEVHRMGPRESLAPNRVVAGKIEAIRYAIGKGVVVVEAGGNGGENLDDSFYDAPQPGSQRLGGTR